MKNKCPKCRKKNAPNAVFCTYCRYPLNSSAGKGQRICTACNTVYPPEMQHGYCLKCQSPLVEYKKKTRLPIIISAASAAVILIGGGLAAMMVYPQWAFDRAIKNEDTEALEDVCLSSNPFVDILDDSENKDKYSEYIVHRTDEFASDRISYDIICDDFDMFLNINSHVVDKSGKIESVTSDESERKERVQKSKLDFELAEKAFEEKNYSVAEEKYGCVIEEDIADYDLSENRLDEIKSMKENVLIDADNQISSGEYEMSRSTVNEGLAVFSYDEDFRKRAVQKVADSVCTETDVLEKAGKYFTSDGSYGAFNLIYSYLQDDQYPFDSDTIRKMREKLRYISISSKKSEKKKASDLLGLDLSSHEIIDRCADQAAEKYYYDNSIQNSNDYIINLFNSDENKDAMDLLSKEKTEVKAVLFTNMAMSSDDFSKSVENDVMSMSGKNILYSGVGRYYCEENCDFSWATIILYSD